MNPAINLTTGIFPTSQIPLDAKCYFKTLADMVDLGDGNFRPFYYYDSMLVLCVENKKQYIWRKRETVNEQGLIINGFTYPNGVQSNGIDYSNQEYNFYLFEQNQKPNQITSGGQISWNGGLSYFVADLTYIINNVNYAASNDNVTFPQGDVNFDRFDAIVVDTLGNILILPGQPAEIPAQPIINNGLYCLVSYVRINSGQTVANVVKTLVYDENLQTPDEFDTSGIPLEDFTFNSPDFSNSNNLNIYFKGRGENQILKTFRFRTTDLLNFVDFDSLEFYVRLEDPNLLNENFISVILKNSNTDAESERLVLTLAYSFDRSLADVYQRIIIPFRDFLDSPALFDIIEFVITDGNHVPFRIDTVSLYSGIPNNNNQLQGFLELIDVFENSYSGKAGYHSVVNDTETGMVLVPKKTDQIFIATANQTDFTIAGTPLNIKVNIGRNFGIQADYTYDNSTGLLSLTTGAIIGTQITVTPI